MTRVRGVYSFADYFVDEIVTLKGSTQYGVLESTSSYRPPAAASSHSPISIQRAGAWFLSRLSVNQFTTLGQRGLRHG
ncbi:hypothetical protein MVLG_03632 [Microbotryum lychnidis-dioicae p1A1 Lamole]|uniref:Uncharacterized protein n=1 Tax=Microbotryum lychnidis-dioicae (strain p1A1 Lamole / MvSl-1064) TaxID=683840 RepID=U5H8T3_USTV1|nr:hypothetical protein MVLG_03632 [Microbotryum lychnidis-dioicae p1A1 Lamole]|eukprot:KDE06082.1 hypothetical protein MVLG_03632 [Microbotryum lychnidis-dioicae p1A1 Lamole]